MKKFLRDDKGFTLIELMVVVVILAILAALVSGEVTGSKRAGIGSQTKSDAFTVEQALSRFRNDSLLQEFPEIAFAGTTFGGIMKGEPVGTGNGTTLEFNLAYTPLVPGSETIYVDGILQERGTNYVIDNETGVITFLIDHIPPASSAITAEYKSTLAKTHTQLDWDATTKVKASDGTTPEVSFIPQFVPRKSTSVDLERTVDVNGDGDTKDPGDVASEYLWLLEKGHAYDASWNLVETRQLQVWELNNAGNAYEQIYPAVDS